MSDLIISHVIGLSRLGTANFLMSVGAHYVGHISLFPAPKVQGDTKMQLL